MLNMIAAELVFAVIFVTVLFLLWPAPPWDLLTYGGGTLMVLLPIFFYPYSKTLFLGFDLLFRPAGYDSGELPDPAAAGTTRGTQPGTDPPGNANEH